MPKKEQEQPPVEAASDEARAAFRTWLVQTLAEAHKEYDKTVTTLSAGALVLSITFLDDIAPSPARARCLLVVAWVAFSASLLSTLVSFATSQHTLRLRIKEIDDDLDPDRADAANRWTAGLNYAAAVLLFIGVVFLALFAFQNLEGGMNDVPKGRQGRR